jgi:exodeoxyribonuclease VII large subunit
VGHETDFTIADFVSDLRAPTPSAAAELAVPDKRELMYKLNSCMNSLCNTFAGDLKYRKNILSQCGNSLNTLNPVFLINQKRQYLDTVNFKIASLLKHKLDLNREKMLKYSLNLDSLSPLSVLGRGYSITCKTGCKTIMDDAGKVRKGDKVDVYLKKGYLKCSVEDVCEEENIIER